ncbi:MAG: dihydroorotate dehydrogenase-like protein [Chloroflexi bacterium]|nr:dihydroorotate dehydrogenase-like protein [Chloroflexota bacterium]
MSNLRTTYMGIPLKNPIVVAASTISHRIDRVRMAEEVGAGALVISSLFEEQIQMEQQHFAEQLAVGSESFPEALSYFPGIAYGEASEHLMWVEKTRKAVQMPLFASLNAVSPGAWVHYARQLEATGVDGLELNVYAVVTDPNRPGAEIEQELYEIVEGVKAEVKIPVAVKLSPFYTSAVNAAAELDKRRVDALVLFNRFLQPTIEVETESLHNEMVYSSPQELKLPLRWIALLYGRVQADLAITTGVHTGQDALRALLAGATIIQLASTILKNGIPYISTILRDIEAWMAEKGYDTIDDFRGNVSQKNCDDPFAFERAQYVRLLLSQ